MTASVLRLNQVSTAFCLSCGELDRTTVSRTALDGSANMLSKLPPGVRDAPERILRQLTPSGLCHAFGFFGPFQVESMPFRKIGCVVFHGRALAPPAPKSVYQQPVIIAKKKIRSGLKLVLSSSSRWQRQLGAAD